MIFLFLFCIDPVFRSCEVLSCQPLTHDIKLLALQLPQGSHMIIPIGYHVYLRVNHNGKKVKKLILNHVLLSHRNAQEHNSRDFLWPKIHSQHPKAAFVWQIPIDHAISCIYDMVWEGIETVLPSRENCG